MVARRSPSVRPVGRGYLGSFGAGLSATATAICLNIQSWSRSSTARVSAAITAFSAQGQLVVLL